MQTQRGGRLVIRKPDKIIRMTSFPTPETNGKISGLSLHATPRRSREPWHFRCPYGDEVPKGSGTHGWDRPADVSSLSNLSGVRSRNVDFRLPSGTAKESRRDSENFLNRCFSLCGRRCIRDFRFCSFHQKVVKSGKNNTLCRDASIHTD